MIPIKYPEDLESFNREYIKALCINDVITTKVNNFFNRNKFSHLNYNLNYILTSNFATLLDIMDEIEGLMLSYSENKFIKLIFNYAKFQDKIAAFFSNHRGDLNLKTCYFCNIDYINGFLDLNDYHNWFDFIKRATKDELLKIDGVGIVTAQKIIDNRGGMQKISDLGVNKNIEHNLKNLNLNKIHNHFTLDHMIDKGTNPLFSLSLYNLVPSCYSCNCKFKKDKKVVVSNSDHVLSPTSSTFSVDKLSKFRVLFFNGKTFHSIRNENDFVIDCKLTGSRLKNYFDIFKLPGRYSFHKGEAKRLIENSYKYNESKIKEMANLINISENELKKNIYGYELFEGELEDKSLTKFKRDIAKSLGIKGIK